MMNLRMFWPPHLWRTIADRDAQIKNLSSKVTSMAFTIKDADARYDSIKSDVDKIIGDAMRIQCVRDPLRRFHVGVDISEEAAFMGWYGREGMEAVAEIACERIRSEIARTRFATVHRHEDSSRFHVGLDSPFLPPSTTP